MSSQSSKEFVLDAVGAAMEGIAQATALAAEVEEGNSEYKFKLTNITEETLQHRITQLNWRLNEGNDEAIYQIGVEDDGNPLGLSEAEMEESLSNLSKMASAVGCSLSVRQVMTGRVGLTAEVVLRRLERQMVNPEVVQVALIGDVDVGKSTLIGVLSSSALDNGRGRARMHVFQYDHEVSSGQTSSVSQHNVCFSVDGNILNESFLSSIGVSQYNLSRNNRIRSRSELELADVTSRVVQFIDLAGHHKYLKTTLHGLVGREPEYALLCVSAKKGLVGMTTEHVAVSMALKIPLLIAITKVDTVSESVAMDLVNNLMRLLKSATRNVVLIETKGQLIELLSSNKSIADVVPIYLVSNVTGKGIDLLRFSLFHLPSRSWEDERSKSTSVRVLTSFRPKAATLASSADEYAFDFEGEDQQQSIGNTPSPTNSPGKNPSAVVAGATQEMETAIFLVQVQTGQVAIDDLMYLGPITCEGKFCLVHLRSIRVNDISVRCAMAGQCATIKIELADVTRTFAATPSKSSSGGGDSEVHSRSTLLTSTSILGLDSLAEANASLISKRRPSAGLIMLPASLSSAPASTAAVDELTSELSAALATSMYLTHSCSPALPSLEQLLPIPRAHWEFTADMLVLNHPSKVRINYEPVVHIGAIKQSARIVSISPIIGGVSSTDDGVGHGQKARFCFRFLYHAEYVVPNANILIREARTRGIGTVVAVK